MPCVLQYEQHKCTTRSLFLKKEQDYHVSMHMCTHVHTRSYDQSCSYHRTISLTFRYGKPQLLCGHVVYCTPLAYTIYHLHIQQSTCMYCTAASKAAPYVITGHTRDRRHATNVRPHLLLSTATAAFRARAIESRMSCTEDSMAASSCSELPKGNLSHFSTRSARKVNTCMEACTLDPTLPTEERNLNGVMSWSVVGFIQMPSYVARQSRNAVIPVMPTVVRSLNF